MSLIRKYYVWLTAILLIVLFLWLRFANIKNSLFFFNDMGRDMMVLQDWWETKKPPLLGPQTSALPINQSAIYFYFLMPLFLLTKGSPMALLYTNAFIYIGFFVFGLYVLRKNKVWQQLLLIFFYLVTISPQYILQSRFVWNPSLTTPFLAVAIMAFYFLKQAFDTRKLWLFTFSLAIALSLSYSLAPVFIAIYLYLIFFWTKNRVKTILWQIVALVLINLPTLVFEIKHKFLLTGMLFNRGVEPQKAADISWVSKFNNLFGYGLGVSGIGMVLLALTLMILILYFAFKKRNKEMLFAASLLGLCLLITFLVPLTIHSHYIFGLTTLLFLSIGLLPKIPRFMVLVLLTLLYLNPSRLNAYFKPAIRTLDQMESCYSLFCSSFKQATFVSVQAGFHPYHNGPEHRYLMRRMGCDVKNIETDPKSAEYMTVVLDSSSFENGVTKYNELSMFGETKEIQRYNCQPNFQLVLLQRSK